jgi:hypothetical protein
MINHPTHKRFLATFMLYQLSPDQNFSLKKPPACITHCYLLPVALLNPPLQKNSQGEAIRRTNKQARSSASKAQPLSAVAHPAIAEPGA